MCSTVAVAVEMKATMHCVWVPPMLEVQRWCITCICNTKLCYIPEHHICNIGLQQGALQSSDVFTFLFLQAKSGDQSGEMSGRGRLVMWLCADHLSMSCDSHATIHLPIALITWLPYNDLTVATPSGDADDTSSVRSFSSTVCTCSNH